MSRPTTVLGQHLAHVEVPPTKALVVVLADIDDFEVTRLARGQEWADAQVGALARILHDPAVLGGRQPSVTFVSPDSWILALGGDDAESLTADSLDLAQAVREAVSASTKVTVTIGVSEAHVGAMRMETALRQAVAGIERKLIDTGNQVTVSSVSELGTVDLPERIERELARAIKDNDVEGALQVLSAWIDRIAAVEGVTPDVLRRWVTAEVMYALDVTSRRRLADGSADWFEALTRLPLDELLQMSDIHDRSYLMLWLQRLLDRIVDVNTPVSAGRHVLALVEEYLEQHFAEDLRLGAVAAEVFVSPYYISHLFQREKGTTFLKYLTSLRMQHARELLSETSLPVDVVASRTGYPSSKRFRTLFKRTFTVTPTEYRAQHRAAVGSE